LRIAPPVDAVIGVGLSKDPGLAFGTVVDRATLAGIALDVRAEFAEARVDALEVARWNVGTTVRLDTKIGAPTTLKVGKVVIAVGDCGIRAQSNAVAITSSPFKEAAR
jgi:Type III flagellar switch regulator (C-ring) FliN C-term